MNLLKTTNKLTQTLYFGILFVLVFVFYSCEENWFGKKNKNFNDKPTQIMHDITLYKSENGKVQANLTSVLVEAFSGDSARTVFPKGVRVVFFNDDLTQKALLTANYAIDYQGSDIVHLQDSVRIINYNNSDTMYCKDLHWDKKAKIVYSHNPIRRYTVNGQDYGDGMTANELFDSVTIINPHGKQTIEDE
ncbi:MAG: LPS export ABC transporter periplasmic protein LptC [Bacteroidota bacterium]|nr:LPS export ABC transporter periplasmic protein LptC [Bacteroidota bacterium]